MQRTPKLTWIGGAFFFDEHNEGPVEITRVSRRIQIRPFATVDAKAWALFGQATYSLSSRVSLTGGVRYTDEQKDIHNTGGMYRLGRQSSPIRPRSMTSSTEPPTTPGHRRASLQVQASRDTFVYLSATRGFKSGGFNITATAARRGLPAPSSPGAMKAA